MNDLQSWKFGPEIAVNAAALIDVGEGILMAESGAELRAIPPQLLEPQPFDIQSAEQVKTDWNSDDGTTRGTLGVEDLGLVQESAAHLDSVADFQTAAEGAPAPDQAAAPSGNGIYIPYEAPPPFIGLEAVGVLPPT